MHTFQRYTVRPRETYSTIRLHGVYRPGNTIFLCALYDVPLSLVNSLLLSHPPQCIPDGSVSLGMIPLWKGPEYM